MECGIITAEFDKELNFSLVWEKQDFDRAEELERKWFKPYRELYNALISGEIDCFCFSKERSSFTVAHRSTRPGTAVQLSDFFVRRNRIVPVRHGSVNTLHDLKAEIPLGTGSRIYWRKYES